MGARDGGRAQYGAQLHVSNERMEASGERRDRLERRREHLRLERVRGLTTRPQQRVEERERRAGTAPEMAPIVAHRGARLGVCL